MEENKKNWRMIIDLTEDEDSPRIYWERIRRYICNGCFPFFHPNQLAHMGVGGCLEMICGEDYF